jgi:hypothetical protein
MMSLMFLTGCAESWLVTRMASNASFLHSPSEWAVEGAGGSRKRGVEDMRSGGVCGNAGSMWIVLRAVAIMLLLLGGGGGISNQLLAFHTAHGSARGETVY